MRTNVRTLNKLITDNNIPDKEVTHFKGKYYLLHICENNNPVPVWISKEAFHMENHIIANFIKNKE